MAKLILSAFSDEYADGLKEQCQALNGFGIEYMEMRGVNGKNVSTLTKDEVLEAKKILNDYAIKVSSIGSPLGKIKIDGDIDAHLEVAKRVFAHLNERTPRSTPSLLGIPPPRHSGTVLWSQNITSAKATRATKTSAI